MTRSAEPLFLIVDPFWEAPTETCTGPSAGGQCPRGVKGRPVACAGRELYLLNSDLTTRWSRPVGAHEDECPLPILVAGGG